MGLKLVQQIFFSSVTYVMCTEQICNLSFQPWCFIAAGWRLKFSQTHGAKLTPVLSNKHLCFCWSIPTPPLCFPCAAWPELESRNLWRNFRLARAVLQPPIAGLCGINQVFCDRQQLSGSRTSACGWGRVGKRKAYRGKLKRQVPELLKAGSGIGIQPGRSQCRIGIFWCWHVDKFGHFYYIEVTGSLFSAFSCLSTTYLPLINIVFSSLGSLIYLQ